MANRHKKKYLTDDEGETPKEIYRDKSTPKIRKTRNMTKKEENAEKISLPAPKEPKKRLRTKKVKKDDWHYKGYTENEYKKYQEFLNEAREQSQNFLKDVLKKNDQKVSGTKEELMQRFADGKVLGKIPRCESCGGGRLRFDYKSGTYMCPGYMEDDTFVWCQKKFDISFIKRQPWIN